MELEDREWVSESLLEADRRRCAARVVSIESEDAVPWGNNYGSELKRLTVKVVLHSGEMETRKVMFKMMPAGLHRKILAKKFGSFAREAKVYQEVLPEMEALVREKDPLSSPIWPQVYGVQRRAEGMLVEDLSVKGFKMADRQKGLDYDHCLLVIRSLAKFHSLAAVLNLQGDLRGQDFEHPMKGSGQVASSFMLVNPELMNVMENTWKGEWVEYAKRLRNLNEKLPEMIGASLEKKSKFRTLNHGDCWLNNVMFRYNKEGELVDLRFIDFQLSNYASPGVDLQYFLQTSPDLASRQRKPELLKEYHAALQENLRLFGYPEESIPPFEEIQEGFKNAAPFGFWVGLSIVPMMMAPPTHAPTAQQIEEFSKDFTEKKEDASFGVRYDVEGEIFVKTLQSIVKEAAENGLI